MVTTTMPVAGVVNMLGIVATIVYSVCRSPFVLSNKGPASPLALSLSMKKG